MRAAPLDLLARLRFQILRLPGGSQLCKQDLQNLKKRRVEDDVREPGAVRMRGKGAAVWGRSMTTTRQGATREKGRPGWRPGPH